VKRGKSQKKRKMSKGKKSLLKTFAMKSMAKNPSRLKGSFKELALNEINKIKGGK